MHSSRSKTVRATKGRRGVTHTHNIQTQEAYKRDQHARLRNRPRWDATGEIINRHCRGTGRTNPKETKTSGRKSYRYSWA